MNNANRAPKRSVYIFIIGVIQFVAISAATFFVLPLAPEGLRLLTLTHENSD